MLLFKVEVYYIEFQLAENSNLEELKKKKFSKSDTLEEIQTVMKELFGIPALEETRLWNKYTSNTYEQLARLDNTVQVNFSQFVVFLLPILLGSAFATFRMLVSSLAS